MPMMAIGSRTPLSFVQLLLCSNGGGEDLSLLGVSIPELLFWEVSESLNMVLQFDHSNQERATLIRKDPGDRVVQRGSGEVIK
jgi:hypothetical protein